MNDGLFFGLCQGYMGLQYHMEDALIENDVHPDIATSNPPYAIFSHKYYNDIQKLDNTKKHDFCFIGSIKSSPIWREWVIIFAKQFFTCKSVFINTDDDPDWISLGTFDLSNRGIGFSPKTEKDNQSRQSLYRDIDENRFYFETMRQSLYTLCPAGDSAWSFRFYETLMCKSMPIVITWHNIYRTKEESKLKYAYVNMNYTENARENEYCIINDGDDYALATRIQPHNITSYDDCIIHNTKIFRTFHMYNKSYEE
jgi:hypothetical protein